MTTRGFASLVLVICCVAPALAEPGSIDAEQNKAIADLYAIALRDAGGDKEQSEMIRFVISEMAKEPAVVEAIPEFARWKAELKAKGYKCSTLDWLLLFDCVIKGNCALRERVAKMEDELRQLQASQEPEPEPTPVMPSPSPDAEYPVAPGPSVVPPLPGPPDIRPVIPAHIDYISDDRNDFCPTATIFTPAVYVVDDDGKWYFGDVYHTCQGNYVLLVRPEVSAQISVKIR